MYITQPAKVSAVSLQPDRSESGAPTIRRPSDAQHRRTMPLVHSHTIGASGNWLRGAVAFLVVWGLGQFIGLLSPLLLPAARRASQPQPPPQQPQQQQCRGFLSAGSHLLKRLRRWQPKLTCTSRGLRTVRTGYAYHLPAC